MAPPHRRDSPPALPDELVEEILLRLPPDDPSCLLRASLVCKPWSRAVSHPGFLRRLHTLHRTPPVLGFLHNWDNERIPSFVPTTASAFSLAAPDCRSWRALDCRHGRALFLSKGQGTQELLVWEPITGGQRRVPVPAAFKSDYPSAADGCDHRDCHGGPFRVVFVFADPVFFAHDPDDEELVTSACVYSSETGTWGELTSIHGASMEFSYYSSVLVGESLLYFLSDGELILEYDLARGGLAVIDPLPFEYSFEERFILMLAKDGGPGVAEALESRLFMWSREANVGSAARWVQSQVIYLHNLLPVGALVSVNSAAQVLGFAEGANVIFVSTVAGLFTIELQWERVRKVCEYRDFYPLIPIVSFYTPCSTLQAPRDEHHDLLPPNPSEEAAGEEGEGKEKTLERAQQLFSKETCRR